MWLRRIVGHSHMLIAALMIRPRQLRQLGAVALEAGEGRANCIGGNGQAGIAILLYLLPCPAMFPRLLHCPHNHGQRLLVIAAVLD